MSRRKSIAAVQNLPPASLPLIDLRYYVEDYRLAGEIAGKSEATLKNRDIATEKLLWFLGQREYGECGPREMRAFLAYLGHGHREDGGRWGQSAEGGRGRERARRPLKASTIHCYYAYLRGFFNGLVGRGILSASPLDGIDQPTPRSDQIQPFTDDQMRRLLQAARRATFPARNVALLLFMLDTGVRASEVCKLTLGDIDRNSRCARIHGKGSWDRRVYFGSDATGALWTLLGARMLTDPDPRRYVFCSLKGQTPGHPLTPAGLHYIVRELGKAAGITGVRCSPHTLRHTCAVNWIRGGGDPLSLRLLLGHSSLGMVNRYVALGSADLAEKHRIFSPADRLRRGKR